MQKCILYPHSFVRNPQHEIVCNYPQNYSPIYSEEDAKIIDKIADLIAGSLIAGSRFYFPKLDFLQRILNKDLKRQDS